MTRRSCLTAVQSVYDPERVYGFIAADFDLQDLPLAQAELWRNSEWRQIKGDPAIRDSLFMQQRVHSPMDARIDDVVAIVDELVCEHGVFHAKLHYSSSRATLWRTDEPYHYHVHVLDDIIDPAVCLAYPNRPYPARAVVPKRTVHEVLERFSMLRFADENLYLRSGSLNVINGMVGLTFSCDGSHYMPYEEFLERDLAFWLGQSGSDAVAN